MRVCSPRVRGLTVAALLALAALPAFPKNLAERLGYGPGAKLVILHTDDLGMAHSVNAASIQALESGAVSSASIMVPPPWFPEIAAWARKHPEADLGLHLTLTSEWTTYRWGPVSSKDRVPSLLDDTGYLHITEDVAAARMNPSEAEAEVRAQIERARAFGIQFTHFDSHMRTLLQKPELLEILLRVGRDYKVPVGVWREIASQPAFAPLFREDDVVIDWLETIDTNVGPDKWADYYANVIRNLKPGVTEIVVHTGYDHPEMRAATADHPNWGSAWRQREFDVLTSNAFRALLREHGVKLVTFREIGKLIPR
ncbi:MAG TPA: polysaccharide deacetylase family protein [Thermoanaerobaculia bacterium]